MALRSYVFLRMSLDRLTHVCRTSEYPTSAVLHWHTFRGSSTLGLPYRRLLASILVAPAPYVCHTSTLHLSYQRVLYIRFRTYDVSDESHARGVARMSTRCFITSCLFSCWAGRIHSSIVWACAVGSEALCRCLVDAGTPSQNRTSCNSIWP